MRGELIGKLQTRNSHYRLALESPSAERDFEKVGQHASRWWARSFLRARIVYRGFGKDNDSERIEIEFRVTGGHAVLAANSSYPLAYCTNVHAGANFAEMFDNLQRHATQVRKLRRQRGAMGIGLWFSNESVIDAARHNRQQQLREWLEKNELVPFTANGFPLRDFHQPIVKHDVYRPDWTSDERREYTLAVIQVMNAITRPELEISVSTLPLGWNDPLADDSFLRACADNLKTVAGVFSELEQRSGRLAYLCLEPEPGCVLDSSDDVVEFFEHWLLRDSQHEAVVRRHLRVCHDICHSAVMWEPQKTAIERFAAAGIEIGKVQISAAIEANFVGLPDEQRRSLWEALKSFAEPRYLHQTTVVGGDGQVRFFEDLPLAFEAMPDPTNSRWRVHFHVPIFWDAIGPLCSTRSQIREFVRGLDSSDAPKHFEVETYAWNVLPTTHAPQSLAAGIAAEMDWFEALA
jgi:hypothetical protein